MARAEFARRRLAARRRDYAARVTAINRVRPLGTIGRVLSLDRVPPGSRESTLGVDHATPLDWVLAWERVEEYAKSRCV